MVCYKLFLNTIIFLIGIVNFNHPNAAEHLPRNKSFSKVRQIRSDNSFDPLNAHGGIFRKLSLNEKELQQISEYHALTDYSKIIELIESKILESEDIGNKEKVNLLKIIHKMRPPKSVKHLLTKNDKHKMKHHYQKQEIGQAMDIVLKRLDEKDPETRREIVDYFGLGKQDPKNVEFLKNKK
uniref:SXP/RAL-2 family protein Ani s 5-like cation-binding domain-containing protein n=1 Tax=Strongyloides stercoralis TaxID=6248 RepID=A0A0K0DW26_STRER